MREPCVDISPEKSVSNLYRLDFLDSSGRPLDDHLSILDTRASGPWSSRIRKVRPQGFAGNKGDSTYNLHGLDVHVDADGETLRVFLVNHRPPLDKATGALLDAHAHGANSTIELFETTLGSTSMKHVRTYAHPEIRTPNKVAAIDGDSFVFTNDHLRKVGAVSMQMRSKAFVERDAQVAHETFSSFRAVCWRSSRLAAMSATAMPSRASRLPPSFPIPTASSR